MKNKIILLLCLMSILNLTACGKKESSNNDSNNSSSSEIITTNDEDVVNIDDSLQISEEELDLTSFVISDNLTKPIDFKQVGELIGTWKIKNEFNMLEFKDNGRISYIEKNTSTLLDLNLDSMNYDFNEDSKQLLITNSSGKSFVFNLIKSEDDSNILKNSEFEIDSMSNYSDLDVFMVLDHIGATVSLIANNGDWYVKYNDIIGYSPTSNNIDLIHYLSSEGYALINNKDLSEIGNISSFINYTMDGIDLNLPYPSTELALLTVSKFEFVSNSDNIDENLIGVWESANDNGTYTYFKNDGTFSLTYNLSQDFEESETEIKIETDDSITTIKEVINNEEYELVSLEKIQSFSEPTSGQFDGIYQVVANDEMFSMVMINTYHIIIKDDIIYANYDSGLKYIVPEEGTMSFTVIDTETAIADVKMNYTIEDDVLTISYIGTDDEVKFIRSNVFNSILEYL